MRIDPSRRSGINETRGKFREYREKSKMAAKLEKPRKTSKIQKHRILPYLLYMGSAAWAEPLLLDYYGRRARALGTLGPLVFITFS